MSETRAPRTIRADYRVFRTIPTRWLDNDAYGHVNNVVYYSWFDTAVNAWLVENGLLDIAGSPHVGLVAETGCTYFQAVSFPESVEVGLAVSRLGRSSVRYVLGVFRPDAELAAAQGHFVHVHVDRETRRPVDVPETARAAMTAIMAP